MKSKRLQDESTLDPRALRIAVGLALESAILSGAPTDDLALLYSDPEPQAVRALHLRLMESQDHRDREAGIWLQTGMDQASAGLDPAGLAGELSKMEYLLYALIPRAGDAQMEVNDWMNYTANAAQLITDGFWVDAKMMLNRALQVSRFPAVVGLKAIPGLVYEVGVFQEATASYYREAMGYPVGLQIPEETLDAALKLQEGMLEVMRSHVRVEGPAENQLALRVVSGLGSSLRRLMEGKPGDARRDLEKVAGLMETWLDIAEGKEKRELVEANLLRVRETLDSLSSVRSRGQSRP
jgi:hypothetical protein